MGRRNANRARQKSFRTFQAMLKYLVTVLYERKLGADFQICDNFALNCFNSTLHGSVLLFFYLPELWSRHVNKPNGV